jgi:hypothetical protein
MGDKQSFLELVRPKNLAEDSVQALFFDEFQPFAKKRFATP